jgi:hypothetical protein
MLEVRERGAKGRKLSLKLMVDGRNEVEKGLTDFIFV